MIEKQFDLFADYFQFYLQDENSSGIDDDSWAGRALHHRLAVKDDAFAVSTARNMVVPVVVAVTDGSADIDLSLWDHVVEFSINVPSGCLVVAGCTDYLPDAARLSIEPGCYEARVLFANLEELSDDGLDGEDHYRIELWKGKAKPLKVTKQHSE